MGEIRFVGTGETRGYPYLVCKKYSISSGEANQEPQRLFLFVKKCLKTGGKPIHLEASTQNYTSANVVARH